MNVLGMYLALKGKGRKITLPNVLGLPTTEHHDHLSQYPKDQTCEFTPMYSTDTTADSQQSSDSCFMARGIGPIHLITVVL